MNLYEGKLLVDSMTAIHNPVFDVLFTVVSLLFNNGYFAILTAIILFFIPKYRKTSIKISIALILCLVIGNHALKPLFARPRPFDLLEYDLIIAAPKDLSFPSGHTQAAFAFATVIFIEHRTIGKYTFILAALVGFSRIYLMVHYPTDVIAGTILGISFAVIASKITNAIYENITPRT